VAYYYLVNERILFSNVRRGGEVDEMYVELQGLLDRIWAFTLCLTLRWKLGTAQLLHGQILLEFRDGGIEYHTEVANVTLVI
jgi:hypothetical protein